MKSLASKVGAHRILRFIQKRHHPRRDIAVLAKSDRKKVLIEGARIGMQHITSVYVRYRRRAVGSKPGVAVEQVDSHGTSRLRLCEVFVAAMPYVLHARAGRTVCMTHRRRRSVQNSMESARGTSREHDGLLSSFYTELSCLCIGSFHNMY